MGWLNPHLIAKFYEVDHLGRMVDDIVVKAALADEADIQMTFNWQSPFLKALAPRAEPRR